MLDWILQMFDPAGFPPRWHCGEWSPFLGWLHILSDFTIWLAYMGIPTALYYFVRRRNDLPLLPVFVLFILFIAFCGIGHLIEASMFWWPAYRFSGAIKLCTAIISLITVVALVPFTRRALALPGTARLLEQLREKSALHDQSRAALHLSKEQLRMATAASGVGLWDLRIDSDHATWDSNTRRIFGLGPDDAIGHREFLLAFVHESDRRSAESSLDTALLDGGPLEARFRIRRRDASIAHIVVRGTAIRDTKDNIIGLSGAFFDVTEEENARLSMQMSLTEKETLLGEVHHRVKNNMQVVSSLLSIQANQLDEPRSRDVLDDCRNRVQTMAMIHETLYSSRNFSALDAGEYTREIAQMVLSSNARSRAETRLQLTVDVVMLNMETAIPLGLIINELVTNATKHAFGETRSGTVRVSLTLDQGVVSLIVGDDGVGMPADASSATTPGMGVRLVRILTRQMNGTVTWTSDQGTQCKVTFDQPPSCAARMSTPTPGASSTSGNPSA